MNNLIWRWGYGDVHAAYDGNDTDAIFCTDIKFYRLFSAIPWGLIILLYCTLLKMYLCRKLVEGLLIRKGLGNWYFIVPGTNDTFSYMEETYTHRSTPSYPKLKLATRFIISTIILVNKYTQEHLPAVT